MNSEKLLDIINCLLTEENIYELFKNHGYEEDIETLKLDLKNLLDDVIKSENELSSVAGGKISKIAAGAMAALTCFPMNSFASGNKNTIQTNSSAFNKISNSIKSGAKKVGEVTKEYVIEPVKDTAKTIVRNPGKSAGLITAVGLAYLLGVLSGKKLAPPPEVVTAEMTQDEKRVIEEAYAVFTELSAKFFIEISEENFSWNLQKLNTKPKSIAENKTAVGTLAEQLMPENDNSTESYKEARKKYIDYEKAQLNTLQKQQQDLEAKHKTEINDINRQHTQELADTGLELASAELKNNDLRAKHEKEINDIKSQHTQELADAELQKNELQEKHKQEITELEKKHNDAIKLAEERVRNECKSWVVASEKPLMLNKTIIEQCVGNNGNNAQINRSNLRKVVTTLLTDGLPKGKPECDFKQIETNKKLTAIKDICLGDVFPLVIDRSRELPGAAGQLDNYKEKGYFATNEKANTLLNSMKTANFWTCLLLRTYSETGKKGCQEIKVVSGIIYCLLWGHINDTYWGYTRTILTGIQEALNLMKNYKTSESQLLIDCLSTINIKYEDGFLKWINLKLE